MNFQKFVLIFLLALFIGRTHSCCCCGSESYKSNTGSCKENCVYRGSLHPPCVEACSNINFLLEVNKKMFKKTLFNHY